MRLPSSYGKVFSRYRWISTEKGAVKNENRFICKWLLCVTVPSVIATAGSEANLLQRLARHYDPNFTAPDADVTSLIDRVSLAVEKLRYQQFLTSVIKQFSHEIVNITHIQTAVLSEIFVLLLKSGDSALVDAAIDACAKEPVVLTSVLRREPSMCLRWSHDAVVIRRLWRSLLFEAGHQELSIFAALLRNALIPAAELDEANAWVIHRLRGDVPRPEDFPALFQGGFFDAFKKFAFENYEINQFRWGNRNAASVRWFVETFPLDKIVTESICTTFASAPYPFEVRDALRQLFASNPTKFKEFEASAKALGRTIPTDLVDNDDIDA